MKIIIIGESCVGKTCMTKLALEKAISDLKDGKPVLIIDGCDKDNFPPIAQTESVVFKIENTHYNQVEIFNSEPKKPIDAIIKKSRKRRYR